MNVAEIGVNSARPLNFQKFGAAVSKAFVSKDGDTYSIQDRVMGDGGPLGRAVQKAIVWGAGIGAMGTALGGPAFGAVAGVIAGAAAGTLAAVVPEIEYAMAA